MKPTITLLFTLLIMTTACGPVTETPAAATEPDFTVAASETEPSTETRTTAPSSTPEPTVRSAYTEGSWQDLPIVPDTLSPKMLEVYQRGLARGHEPSRFSKFGDCQNVPSLFLGIFDTGAYSLGEEYSYLQSTIDYYAGSWSRQSLAVKGGLNVAAVQTLYYTDPENCELTESPMVCELRVYNPTLVVISFETWWADKPVSTYEERLRAVVDYVLSQEIVPILATKADNIEGEYAINNVIGKVAYEYELPLWNFWAATYGLPSHGVYDGFHLTFAQNYFDDPVRMEAGWPWRNLTALQVIDAIHRTLEPLP